MRRITVPIPENFQNGSGAWVIRHNGRMSVLAREGSLIRRLYLLLGDLLANAGVGALAALIVAWIVGPGWNPLVGMVIGMALGAVVSLVVLSLLTPLFGAFEIMLPGMTSGMVAGMVIGMRAAMGAENLSAAAGLGAGLGLAVLIAVQLLDRAVRRQEVSWTS